MSKLEYFLIGVFAALGALVLEIMLDSIFFQPGLFEHSLYILTVFVLIEELAKFIVICQKIDLTAPLNLIGRNCFWIGLGFGLLELGILMLNDEATYHGNTSSIAMVLLLHIATVVLTGLLAAKLRIRNYYLLLAIIPSLILHLAFNYWVTMG